MTIVAIAWLYVVFMMSITEQSAVAGVATFLLYGVFPLTIVLYLMGTPQRKRNRHRKMKMAESPKEKPDRTPSSKCEPDVVQDAGNPNLPTPSTMVQPGRDDPPAS